MEVQNKKRMCHMNAAFRRGHVIGLQVEEAMKTARNPAVALKVIVQP